MSNQDSSTKDFLYQDESVQITDKSVKVLKFYFPQDSKNQIFFKDINKLGLKEMDEMDETLGVDSSFFKDFKKRAQQNKNMYIEMAVEDESVRLSFAPDEPQKVMKLIEKKWEDAKIENEKNSSMPLQQNTLYSNVEMTPQKIQQAMDQLKKSEKDNLENPENEKKRQKSPPMKKQEQEQDGNPKKKIKQNDTEVVNNEENRKPDLEVK